VISVALKTHLEIRLGIYIYKTSLLHRPDDYIGDYKEKQSRNYLRCAIGIKETF